MARDSLKFTAKGHGYYRVLVEGEEVSKHTTEREALQSAANHYEDDLEVKVIHDYEVSVVKTASGKIVNVKVRTKRLKLNQPMAVITYTVPGFGITNPDTTPDQFTFTDQTGVTPLDLITSNTITVTGITLPAAISISGTNDPEYQVNGGAWVNTAGTVSPNAEITVRHTASAFLGISIDTVVTIGGVSDTFTSTTTGAGGFASVMFDAPTYHLDNDGLNPEPSNYEIPPASILWFESGQHTGANGVAVLEDNTKTWVVDYWVDVLVRNISDSIPPDNSSDFSQNSVARRGAASNTLNTITLKSTGLTGGNRNTWNTGDHYEIISNPTLVGGTNPTIIHYQTVTNLGGALVVDSKGIPHITGVAGMHSFDWYLENSNNPLDISVTATCTVEVL